MPGSPFRNRVLVLFAHPALRKSRVNRRLALAAREIPGITFHDLYETYPDLVIDIKHEQKLLEAHDIVVLQHPFYWYSVPAIFKEWVDLVLEYGWAYGEGGTKLAGKAWIHALTASGSEEAYTPAGYNRFTVRQMLAPLEQTARLCNMYFLSPFVLHSVLKLDPRTEVPARAREYRALLEVLRDTPLEWAKLCDWPRINPHVEELRAGRIPG